MNNKGFMMAELVVVSSIILVALVGLYTSYNKIFSIYNQRVNYYDVATLYELAYIREGIDYSTEEPSITKTMVNSSGSVVYYIDKYDIKNLDSNVTNQTFKDYLKFLEESFDYEGLNSSNILVMEKCVDDDSDGVYNANCKYAYLEVFSE